MSNDQWYREGLRFECTQCGNCCSGAPGYVWLSREEMEKIAAHLRLGFKEFTRRYTRRVGFKISLLEKADLDCVFLKREHGKTLCTIHSVRPLQCRTWPFWNVNLKTPTSWARAAGDCPGMNTGPVHNFVTIEQIRTAKQWSDLPSPMNT